MSSQAHLKVGDKVCHVHDTDKLVGEITELWGLGMCLIKWPDQEKPLAEPISRLVKLKQEKLTMKIINRTYHIEETYHDDNGRTLTNLDIQLAIENYIADHWAEDGPVDIEVTKQQ